MKTKDMLYILKIKVSDIAYNLGLIKDYITETGTSNSWDYRKWKGGTYDASYRGNINLLASTGAWCGGQIHPASSIIIPPSLSTSITSFKGTPQGAVLGWCVGYNASTYQSYWINGATNATNNYPVLLELTGRWD